MFKKFEQSDDFLKKLIKNKVEAKPAKGRGNTPIAPLIFRQKENQNMNINSPLNSKSPRSKPVLKRKNTHTKTCANHPQKSVEYQISIDDETFEYCNKCASQLASQGFSVEKIGMSIDVDESIHPRKQQLSFFLTSLKDLQNTYKQKLDLLSHINYSYETEKSTILNFYGDMLDYIENMRNQHLLSIEKESLKHIQICQIECGQINETIQEMEEMREDVESNIESIIGEVEEQKYRECMSYYTQKLGLYEHRLEELGLQAQQAPELCQQQIEARLDQFKKFVEQLTGIQINGQNVDEQM